jgi:O-antigen/teichoic acid export membrane protein
MSKIPKIDNLKRRLTPGPSLSQKVVFGVGWISALKIVDQLLGLIRITVLARLLTPGDFGLFGIAMLAISIIESFTNSGFQTALIQKKKISEVHLDIAWTIHVIRGVILSLLLFVFSPLIAGFFDDQGVVWLLRALSISVLIMGFENIGIVQFQKDLEFHKDFIYRFSGTIADVAIVLPAAFLLRSVWALVFGLFARRIAQTVLSYFFHPYRPRLRLAKKELGELFSFGKWATLSVILSFGYTQGDDLFVGKILGTVSLGLYQMAYRISRLLVVRFTSIITQVTVPAYSKLQNEKISLQKAYLQTQKVLCYISAPIAAGTALLAYDFTGLFLGERWISMVPALQILTIVGFFVGINSNLGPLVVAIGRPDLGTWMNAGRLGLLVILIYPFSLWWGLNGVALSIAIVTILVMPLTFYMAVRHTEISIWRLLYETTIPILMTLIMIGILALIRNHFLAPIGFFDFGIIILLGASIYLLLTLLVDKIWNYGAVNLFLSYYNKLLKESS